jgi:hypothetical protein
VADLAKLVVRLEAQSAQLLTELEKANNRIARFERNAGQSLDRLNRRFDKFGFGIKATIGAILTGVSIGKIVQANAEAAQSFALLENAVERAGHAAGGRTASDFAKVAKEIAKVTTVTGGAVQGVQQLLLRFQNIRTDRFDDATRAVLDFAAATNRELGAAAEVVGKALSDPVKGINALQKAGVRFSEGQRRVIADLVETGRRAEAQGIVLDALSRRFDGAAEKARENFGGALQAVKNAIDDLMESESGLPSATKSLNEMANILQDDGIKHGADVLFSTIITGAAKAAEFVAKIGAGLAIIFRRKGGNPLVDLDLQIQDLREELADELEDLEDLEGPVGELARGAIVAQYNEQIDALIRMQEELTGVGEGALLAAERAKAAGGEIGKAFELPEIEVVWGALDEEAEKLRKRLEQIGKSLTEQLQTPLERYNAQVALADQLLKANTITTETWARALGAARLELEGVGTGIVEVADRFRTLEEQMEDAFREDNAAMLDDLMEEGADRLTKEFDAVLERSEKSWNVFADQAARNTQDILADAIYDGITEGWDGGIEGLLDRFGEMLTRMAAQAVAADIAGKIFGIDEKGNPGGGGGWLDKLLGSFGRGGAGAGGANSIAQGEHDWMDVLLKSGNSSGGGLWDSIFESAGSVFGGMRDHGGRGRPGEVVAIGRGAQPELFVPDTTGDFYPAQQWMGGGAKITQNIYTQGPMTQRSARQLQVEAARNQRTATARLG